MNAQSSPRKTAAGWVKSSYSDGDGGQCVECSPSHLREHGVMPLRDSKNPGGAVLSVPGRAWASFLGAVTSGDLA